MLEISKEDAVGGSWECQGDTVETQKECGCCYFGLSNHRWKTPKQQQRTDLGYLPIPRKPSVDRGCVIRLSDGPEVYEATRAACAWNFIGLTAQREQRRGIQRETRHCG